MEKILNIYFLTYFVLLKFVCLFDLVVTNAWCQSKNTTCCGPFVGCWMKQMHDISFEHSMIRLLLTKIQGTCLPEYTGTVL